MELRQRLLEESRTIAVVGLSPDPERPSYQVAEYLQAHGYRIIPVNPGVEEVLGEKSYPGLHAIPERVDMVDIFRQSEAVLPVVEEAVKLGLKAIWMQDGVVNEDAAALARNAGAAVVMNDCTMRVHRRLSRAPKDLPAC